MAPPSLLELSLLSVFLEPFYLFPIFLPITRITTFLSHSPSPLFWGSISTSLCLHPCHPLSFSCCMLHLGLWSFLFVPRLSSPPQPAGIAYPSQNYSYTRGGQMKGRDYFTLLFIRSASPEFLLVRLHTLKSSPSFLL